MPDDVSKAGIGEMFHVGAVSTANLAGWPRPVDVESERNTYAGFLMRKFRRQMLLAPIEPRFEVVGVPARAIVAG